MNLFETVLAIVILTGAFAYVGTRGYRAFTQAQQRRRRAQAADRQLLSALARMAGREDRRPLGERLRADALERRSATWYGHPITAIRPFNGRAEESGMPSTSLGLTPDSDHAA